MGLLGWLFPSPEQKIETARGMLHAGRWRDARDTVDGLLGPDAEAVRKEARRGLVKLNLDAARNWAEAGEDERVAESLELAESFHDGGLEAEFRETRRSLRELRDARRQEAAQAKARQARHDAVDPLGLVGRGLIGEQREEADLSPDAVERQARLDLTLENYPPELRKEAASLGSPFAHALLDYEDGRPDLAWRGLMPLADVPVVHYERSRCAFSLGDLPTAIANLRAFAATIGHQRIGGEHTAVMLAQWLAQTGDLDGALRLLRDVHASEPAAGAMLHANLLLAVFRRSQRNGSAAEGLLEEAEDVLRDLIAKVGGHPNIYHLLAQIRLAAGHRVPAMQALELAMKAFGHREPDKTLIRQLATLYLEDKVEVHRGEQLAEDALANLSSPVWEDLYLDALLARQRGESDAWEIANRLWADTRADDPRRDLLERHLPQIA